MDKDYEVIDGEHGIIRETKDIEPSCHLGVSTEMILSEGMIRALKAFVEELTMNLKDYMIRKKEDEKRARKRKNKRRTAKRTTNRKS